MIADAAGHPRVVTVEDGIRDGGIGMSIADAICELRTPTEVHVLGLPTKFIPHDPNSNRILARFGLDAEGIVAAARNT
jgi:1-deoxy-D-xylulose-5-phosphate synthase